MGLYPSATQAIDAIRDGEQGNGLCNSKICEGDVWLLLDLDEWFPESNPTVSERMFTLRISSPASTPADFKMSLFPSMLLSVQDGPEKPPRAKGEIFNLEAQRARWMGRSVTNDKEVPLQLTRRMYARIRASTAKFVRAPNPDGSVIPFQSIFLPTWFLPAPLPPSTSTERLEIKFHIVLEPLVFGVLPESLIAGVVFLVALLIPIAWLAVPRVNAAFSKLADRARKGKGKIE